MKSSSAAAVLSLHSERLQPYHSLPRLQQQRRELLLEPGGGGKMIEKKERKGERDEEEREGGEGGRGLEDRAGMKCTAIKLSEPPHLFI